MNIALKSKTVSVQENHPLRECCLICDGNAHRPDLSIASDFTHDDILHESSLPQIRTTALLIAASRHDWSQATPTVFAQEADWFAARILVLKVRAFHLDVRLAPMLRLANQRAEKFAQQHGLVFQEATIRPSLHKNRPVHVLLMACDFK